MKKGVLYVVSTPIGNLEDITARAVRILKEVDVVACEDTRKTRILLGKWGIPTRLISVHRFSEAAKSRKILRLLDEGHDVAIVSDAGTPGISDPGARLVRAAHEAGFRVTPVPGPSSVTAALSASGFDASSFVHVGFVPRKAEPRKAFFEQLCSEERTAVFFETPVRVKTTLADASPILGSRSMVLFRELTKIHEEILVGDAQQILAELRTRPSVKGEIIVVVQGAPATRREMDVTDMVKELMSEGFSGKRLAAEAQRRYGVKKGDAYRRFVEIKGERPGSGES